MTDLASDPTYIEACRHAAWSSRPLGEINRYWDSANRRFCFPTGWPEGCDPETFVRRQIEDARAPASAERPKPIAPLSPSVQRLREMLR